jgi:hypothetical protein
VRLLGRKRPEPRGALDTAELERAAEEAFDFLRAEEGFRRLGGHRGEDRAEVRYRGNGVGIDVSAGRNGVGVTIGRLDRAGRMRAFERDDWSHWWWVIQDLVPDRRVRERLGRRDANVTALLAEHAAALKAYGRAVLRGDFTGLENVDWWQFRNG